MSELDLPLLHFLFTENPPVNLVKSLRQDFRVEDPRVIGVLDYLCTSVPEGHNVPGYDTMYELYPEGKEALKESVACEKVISNLNDYTLLYHKEETDKKVTSLIDQLSDAVKNGNRDLVIDLSNRLSLIDVSGKRMIGPMDPEEFMDIALITKKPDILTTHIPRLNQHLGGEPDDIDFEDIGGFYLGEITIIAGSVNRGKSAFATSLWQHFIRQSLLHPQYKSVYFNYEGALDRFRKTMFAHITGVYPFGDTKFYQNAILEYEAFMQPRMGNFLLYDAGGKHDMPYTTRALEAELSRLAELGYKAFFVDTINSLDDSTQKEWETGEKTMRMLENVVKRYNIQVTCTAQNKQGLEFEDQPWPDMKWIGSSHKLQQKPGIGLGIYRTDLYSGGQVDYSELAIIKARHRAPYPREGVKVSYDKRRRMIIPYTGTMTGVVEASEMVQKKQILTALKSDDVAFAFGRV
jgi:hypothetical protein